MKQFARSEKLKLIEGAKTVIIVLLFFLCLFLGYKILDLYKSQANVQGAIWGSVPNGSVQDMGEYSSNTYAIYAEPQPDIIAVNSNIARRLVDGQSNTFETLADLSNQLLGKAYKAKSEEVFVSDRAEWQNALMSDSVYFKYSEERFLSTESELYGVKSIAQADKIQSFADMLVVFDVAEPDAANIFMMQSEDKTVAKTHVSGEIVKLFKDKVKKINLGNEKEYAFAWELHLDEKLDEGKVVLDSMLLIPTAAVEAQEISVDVPRLYKSGLNFTKPTDLTLGLVNAFNYNPNTIRQYVNRNNSIMFVGETGSLALHPDGLIEYKALDADDGVALGEKKDFAEINRRLCKMLEEIMRISGINTINTEFKIKPTKLPKSFQLADKTEICFDYYAGNKKVEFSDTCAIRAVVQKGKLVELRMYLKDIEQKNEQHKLEMLIDAIDKFCVANPNCSKIVRAVGVYKLETDAEELKAEWKIEGVR